LTMLEEITERWRSFGRPLMLSPQIFKERILTDDLDSGIQLNYQKWLQ